LEEEGKGGAQKKKKPQREMVGELKNRTDLVKRRQPYQKRKDPTHQARQVKGSRKKLQTIAPKGKPNGMVGDSSKWSVVGDLQ